MTTHRAVAVPIMASDGSIRWIPQCRCGCIDPDDMLPHTDMFAALDEAADLIAEGVHGPSDPPSSGRVRPGV